MTKYFYCFFLISSFSKHLHAQDTLYLRDSQEIQLLAQRKVEKGLNDLLNTIIFEDLGEFERKAIMTDSYGNSVNKIFYDANVIVEDDLNPEHTSHAKTTDLPIVKYLNNFELFYPKSTDRTILFSDFSVSNLKKADYYYVKVYFKCLFKGQHKQINIPYRPLQRVAEVRAEKKGKKWAVHISRVAFMTESDSTNVTLNDILLAGDSAKTQVVETTNESEIARQKEREAENAALREYNSWLDKGDKAFAAQDYDNALEAYTEAEKRNDYDDLLPRRKIYQVKRAFDKEKQTQENLLKEYLAKASIAQKTRNYPEAIGLLRKALTLKPDSSILGETIKLLNHKSRIKTELDEKYNAGNYSEVIKDYTRILKKEKDNSDHYLGRGLAYTKTNDLDRALKDFIQAIDLDFANLAALKARAELYVLRKNIPKAIADLTSYINIDNTATDIFSRRAELRIQTNNISGAFEDYTRTIELSPKTANHFFNRGLLWYQIENYSNAIDDFTTAIKLNNKYNDAYYQRGLSNIKLNQVNQAGDDFSQLRKLSISPQQEEQISKIADAYFEKAFKIFNEKKYESSIKAFEEVLSIKPTTAEAWYYRANGYKNTHDTLTAIESYDMAVSLRDNYSEAFFERGQLWFALQKFEKAAKDYHKAYEIYPAFYQAIAGEGHALFAQELYEKAIISYEFIKTNEKKIGKTLSDSTIAVVYNQLGISYFLTQQTNKAIEEFERSLQKNDNFSEAYFNRGQAFEADHSLRKAIYDYRKAVGLDTGNPRKYLKLGIALHKNENYSEAILAFSETIEHDPNNSCCRALAIVARADIYYLLKENQKAIEDYISAFELDSSAQTPEAQLNISMAFLQQNQPEKSISFLTKINSTGILKAQSYYVMGCAYAQQKNQENAIKYFEKSFQTGLITRSYLRKDKLLEISDKKFEHLEIFKNLINKYIKK